MVRSKKSQAGTGYTYGKIRQTRNRYSTRHLSILKTQKPILSMKKGWAHVTAAYGAWDSRRPSEVKKFE